MSPSHKAWTIAVLGTAAILSASFSLASKDEVTKSYQLLLDDWCLDCSAVEVVENPSEDDTGNLRGLFVSKDIAKGQLVVSMRYQDLSDQVVDNYPSYKLKDMVEQLLHQAISDYKAKEGSKILPNFKPISSGSILTLVGLTLLLEGENTMQVGSSWASFIDTLPSYNDMHKLKNALHWTPEAYTCVVPRPDSHHVYAAFEIYTQVVEELKARFPPLRAVSTETIEYAYLIKKTRGFGDKLLPIMDMANHNPLKAHPVFVQVREKRAYFIATDDMKAGDEVFNFYGPLSPMNSAEEYGFVDPNTPYFDVPSIHRELLTSPGTRKEVMCTQDPVRFFGNMTEQVVYAEGVGTNRFSAYYKAFMPTELAYACIRVLLQTEDDTKVSAYVAKKLKEDLLRYKEMTLAPHCQPNSTSLDSAYTIIQSANRVTARLMYGAFKEAKRASKGEIAYPGISKYTRSK